MKIINVVSIVCFVTGVSLFFGFFFGMVKPETDEINQIKTKECRIDGRIVQSHRCPAQEHCECVSCGSNPPCSVMVTQVNNTGNCCHSRCCARRRVMPYLCSSRVCSGSGKRRTCSTVTRTCYHSVCVEHVISHCYMFWGDCFDVSVHFHINDEDADSRVTKQPCGFNDFECVAELNNRFQDNSTHQCYHHLSSDTVSFTPPSNKSIVGGWVGTSFGIFFLFVTLCLFLCTNGPLLLQRMRNFSPNPPKHENKDMDTYHTTAQGEIVCRVDSERFTNPKPFEIQDIR